MKINQFNDVAKDRLDEWIFFLKNEEIKDKFQAKSLKEFQAKGLKKAKEVLDLMNLSEDDRVAYESYAENLRYQASMYQSSYGVGRLEGEAKGRAEGRAEGRAKGRAKGRAEGRAKGRAKGRVEGRTEEKMSMARLMKQNGEPIEKIMHYTHLSQEDGAILLLMLLGMVYKLLISLEFDYVS